MAGGRGHLVDPEGIEAVVPHDVVPKDLLQGEELMSGEP